MDTIDKKILSALQKDGRMSITDLANHVGLSLSPCHRRVKQLEESGAIKGYSAQLDPSKIGLQFSAIVFINLKEGNNDSIKRLENALIDIPEIVQAQRLFGDPDYMLHVVAENLEDFQKLYDEKLSNIPSILRLTSTIVMKNVIAERIFPIW
ncbi:Lrp/AsnC family transcriptional regulator [Ignatzschineria sp. RMDPL8A]|uniref:Lrp/AsnC family transcriptional regulator n=1 Tax=Ignatzschineria sp. RMDPL8A TaxID=2999236 RepID=UPI0016B7B5DD|nr:Lrp/AsnC family transcriptional regulator [Ignatzschineria sp. RMDPL8A]MDG9730472.1 Lrp/AsnC family transcriptional regulator [Ignatzschineria sp. RMDPL8A]NLD09299.1 Lrp/AsnC family transcriptional regulator [Xanthomonadaceae bacterium]